MAFFSFTRFFPNTRPYFFLVPLFSVLIAGCSKDNSEAKLESNGQKRPASIKLNQVGYPLDGQKHAVVTTSAAQYFQIMRTSNNKVAYKGELGEPVSWELSGDTPTKLANFSEFDEPGEFYLQVDGLPPSPSFVISHTTYHDVHRAASKYFYFNRAGIALIEEFAGRWKRPAGHPDTQVIVHPSATTPLMDAHTSLLSEKGWYDAGDYGKYTVNSGIATYTLLAAYEHYTQYYQTLDLGIPESDNVVPDLLDEVRWNLDWMATMQRHDGAVFHKLTTLEWPGLKMPHEDNANRYMIGVSTGATLDFAATMAMASRIYQSIDPNAASQWLQQAEAAWQWAVLNADVPYIQPQDVESGEYGDENFQDEFFWAAAELFIATESRRYLNHIENSEISFGVPGWGNVETLGAVSLLKHARNTLPLATFRRIRLEFLALADSIVMQIPTSAYQVPMQADDFVWGSNSVLLNKAIVLLNAHQLSGSIKYKKAVYDSVSYIFGMNPTGYSFVTGYGSLTPMTPHHRISQSDGIDDPVPGMLVGGPHAGRQDNCEYPYPKPADSYIDDWCSFSTNEVAINWNAPLVYVLGAINAWSQ